MLSLLAFATLSLCMLDTTNALSETDKVVPLAQRLPVNVSYYDVTSKTGAKSILSMEAGNTISANKTSFPEGYTVVQEAIFSGACYISYSVASNGKLQGTAFVVGLTNFTNWYKADWDPAHLWVVPDSVCENLTNCSATAYLDSSIYYVLAIANNGPAASSKRDLLLTTYKIAPENSTQCQQPGNPYLGANGPSPQPVDLQYTTATYAIKPQVFTNQAVISGAAGFAYSLVTYSPPSMVGFLTTEAGYADFNSSADITPADIAVEGTLCDLQAACVGWAMLNPALRYRFVLYNALPDAVPGTTGKWGTVYVPLRELGFLPTMVAQLNSTLTDLAEKFAYLDGLDQLTAR